MEKTEKAAEVEKRSLCPRYTFEDALGAIELIAGCNYQEIVNITDGVQARFVDAGHLLGSSSIEIWLTEEDEKRKIVFSGDIGNEEQPIIKDPQYIEQADYVVIESTYGEPGS